MAKGKAMEHFCVGCGFSIVTDYPYHPTCPICGGELYHKPASGVRKTSGRENKKSKGAKKENGTD